MVEHVKGCGEEGHVCVCAGNKSADSVTQDFSMSLEDFLLMRLEMSEEFENCSDLMIEMTVAGLLIVAQCIQLVKITSKHDEIAEALKSAILALDKNFPEHTGLLKMIGLIDINKLESEKKGEAVDWEYGGKLTPGNPFIVEELQRVFGV